MKTIIYRLTVSAIIVFLFSIVYAAGQSSDNYIIETDVISGGGGDGGSANYDSGHTTGQPSPIGESSSGSYDNSAGFWYAACSDNDDDGYSTCDGDCADDNAAANPGSTEINNNGIDDDCNPSTPVNTASGSGYNFPVPLFRASLSLNVNAGSLGTSWLKYYYTKTRMSLVSTSITSISATGGMATVAGVGSVNNVPGCTFTATVTDGSPDAMGIVITSGGACATSYSAGSQGISSGGYVAVGQ